MATENNTPAGKTEEDIARELIPPAPGPGADLARIGDLKTLRAISDEAQAYQQALGVPDLDPTQDQQLVAVSTGTDMEKDRALVTVLKKRPEIDSCKPEVFGRLSKLSGALSSADEASTRLTLNLLQAVVDFDAEEQEIVARLVKLLGQPPETLLTPTITVGWARTFLGTFIKALELQQGTAHNRSDRHRRQKEQTGQQVEKGRKALSQQESVQRLHQAAESNKALPAGKDQKGKGKRGKKG